MFFWGWLLRGPPIPKGTTIMQTLLPWVPWGDHLRLYQIHSATLESGVLETPWPDQTNGRWIDTSWMVRSKSGINSPVEVRLVVGLSHDLQRFSTIPGGCLGFLSSTVSDVWKPHGMLTSALWGFEPYLAPKIVIETYTNIQCSFETYYLQLSCNRIYVYTHMRVFVGEK